jgi:hypothetical protein
MEDCRKSENDAQKKEKTGGDFERFTRGKTGKEMWKTSESCDEKLKKCREKWLMFEMEGLESESGKKEGK